MTTKKGQIIFIKGKEAALKSLFNGQNGTFGYLAVGYKNEDNGFVDPDGDTTDTETGFMEVSETGGYHRVELSLHNEDTEIDTTTGKVLVKFEATLDENNIQDSRNINQIAVVDNATIGADTIIYSATTFPTFTKSKESSITFVLGFRL